jgi:hypothetical protein
MMSATCVPWCTLTYSQPLFCLIYQKYFHDILQQRLTHTHLEKKQSRRAQTASSIVIYSSTMYTFPHFKMRRSKMVLFCTKGHKQVGPYIFGSHYLHAPYQEQLKIDPSTSKVILGRLFWKLVVYSNNFIAIASTSNIKISAQQKTILFLAY